MKEDILGGLRTQCMLESFPNKQSVCIHNAFKIVLYDSWQLGWGGSKPCSG